MCKIYFDLNFNHKNDILFLLLIKNFFIHTQTQKDIINTEKIFKRYRFIFKKIYIYIKYTYKVIVKRII